MTGGTCAIQSPVEGFGKSESGGRGRIPPAHVCNLKLLGKQRQNDLKFKVSLGNIVSP